MNLVERNDSRWRWVFGVFLILPMVMSLYRGFKFSVVPDMYNSYDYTEFMINYEGGFVRRGLLGQLLYRLCAATGWSPEFIIIPLSATEQMADDYSASVSCRKSVDVVWMTLCANPYMVRMRIISGLHWVKYR